MVDSVACESSEAERAFVAFYQDAYDRAARLGFLLTGSAPVGEELAQDAFVHLYRRWTEIREPAAWVRVAIVNGSRSWWRKAGRQAPLPEPPSGPDPTDALVIRAALASLSPRHRTALVLRYFEDLPERAIAELMDCPVGTVKSLLHRGLQRMKESLS
jgi:RNA polymerase sigma factor (sigma-70 family)